MEFRELEREAIRTAGQRVANMLQTPDKLERVHQMKKNAAIKKSSVEAMLKTAMQSQLDGVRTGLTQLESSLSDVKAIKEAVGELDVDLKRMPRLLENLREVRAETLRHSQLQTATDNLQHLFTVPETAKQTEILIEEGQLLEAHQNLAELEESRDDLLLELHKFNVKFTESDKELLKEYFSPVSELNTKLEKQIKFILRRTLNTVRKDPKVVVTALRIVEREEKLDLESLNQKKMTGFLAPDRPKRWRTKALDVLKLNVQERIEGNQLEDRDSNKMWLVRHLELVRLITIEDLRVAKTLCQPAFPPDYEILDHFIHIYNEALKNRLSELIQVGLQDQEYVTMLQWVIQTYPGPDLMASPRLKIPASKIKPLLDLPTVESLQSQYLANMRENYGRWMRNAMDLEVKDWKKDQDPDLDSEGCFHTSAPKMIYQMIEENLQVAATIAEDLTTKVLEMSMGQLANFGNLHRDAIDNYKDAYFKDRTKILMFTRYMIAIINNCTTFEQLAVELKTRWSPKAGQVMADFEEVLKIFSQLHLRSSEYLLDEAFLDMDGHFVDILSPRWMSSPVAIDTVCGTLEDYFNDYNYLQQRNFERVVSEARDRVARKYIFHILSPSTNAIGMRKSNFETPDDRRRASHKIKAEAAQLKRFFRKYSTESFDLDFDSPFNAVSGLGEVLAADPEMLFLDVGSFLKNYPDVSQQQLLFLLLLRGDQSKSEAKTMASDFVPDVQPSARGVKPQSIFSQVTLNASNNPFGATLKESNLNPFGNDF